MTKGHPLCSKYLHDNRQTIEQRGDTCISHIQSVYASEVKNRFWNFANSQY